MSGGGRRYRGRPQSALASLVVALVAPGVADAATITFDDLTPHPPPTDTAGLTVNSQYSGQGVTFNNPKVKAKRPRVLISSPASSAQLSADQTLQLVASVQDLQDVPFKDANVSWTSSLQGKLGEGTAITATLQPGTHQITATATNSASKSGSATVTVDVSALPPVFTVP
jgi:PKD domain